MVSRMILTYDMRNLLLTALCLLTSSLAHAQLRPPVQTDTLMIKSVKYNFMDIKPENWPCKVIYKSTTDFRIGEQVFNIISVREDVSIKYEKKGVAFTMEDNSKLYYYESPKERVVVYSGYEFFCEGIVPTINSKGTGNSVSLQGRQLVGSLPKPQYVVQDEGIVVVSILVDQYGNVTQAKAGVEGSTTDNKNLLTAARAAAIMTHFNQDATAPAVQEGTITYVFKLQ